MGEQTGISWADKTWSPWYGCTQVSLGDHGACVGCYARQISETRMHRVVFGGPGRGIGTRDVRADSAWSEPLRWERMAAASKHAWFAPGGPPEGGMGRPWPYSPLIFPSMCDPFDNHPSLREPRVRFLRLIRATPHLTWLLLTKRPQNIERLYADACLDDPQWLGEPWPSNAATGCTVVTQEEADRDVPHLLGAKAALKPAFAFVSMEPLLGPVDLTAISTMRFRGAEVLNGLTGELSGIFGDPCGTTLPALDWVITGGETDQGAHKARPTHPDWLRSIRDQCAAAGVPYHHKQNGEWLAGHQYTAELAALDSGDVFSRFDVMDWRDGQAVADADEFDLGEEAVYRVGKKRSGRLLDGVLHDAMPEVANAL